MKCFLPLNTTKKGTFVIAEVEMENVVCQSEKDTGQIETQGRQNKNVASEKLLLTTPRLGAASVTEEQ